MRTKVRERERTFPEKSRTTFPDRSDHQTDEAPLNRVVPTAGQIQEVWLLQQFASTPQKN